MRNFKFDKSCFSEEHTIYYDCTMYEFIDATHEDGSYHAFRVIFSEDDYDYVEDEELIKKLRLEYDKTK